MAEVAAAAGFLGPAIDLWKCIYEPMKRQVIYLCCFNTNVQNLQTEATQLDGARVEVQSMVDAAQNNAGIVFSHVQNWLKDVSEILTEKSEIDNEITTTRNGGRCTVGCRYPLSKKVKRMAEAMKKLRQESGNVTTNANPGVLTTVSRRPPPAATSSTNLRSSFEFYSRKSVEEEVMFSLRDEKTYMVGICGMGGVGKTTMANTIMHRARNELGFQETVMVVVSQVVNKSNIQDDIADSLGLKFEEKSISSKAHLLRIRLSPGTRKTLIVIDDVWAKLDLVELGIPCSNTCKVLITSRNRHTLEAMEVYKLHAVQILSNEEAWELFKSKAGDCFEKESVVDVARQVVDECNGLPLALVTVGVALKNKKNSASWDNALKQLKSDNPRHMPEVIKDVYQPLKLSYDFLDDDHQKSLFLMCCLFPEDSNIPLETLENICKGLLHLNEDLQSSRNATFDLVDRLKDRFLLLEGKDGNHLKMHDVVRDVAIYIAAREKRIKCNECTWISPNIGERIGAHEESSPSPFSNLHLLWIDCESTDKEWEIKNNFFGGMIELKVIMIKCRSLQRLPETRGLLNNLRTLVLEDCEYLESLSAVGELVNLEILICRFCRTIESLPVEIGRLRQLRILELSRFWKLKTIAPGIISNLRKLEELIVDMHFDGWEARIVEGERKNAPLCELQHLSNLTRLTIGIRDKGLAAESFHLPPNLLKFHITFGDFMNDTMNSSREKKLKLELSAYVSWGNFLKECVRSVEHIYIKGDGSMDLQLAQNLRQLDIINSSTMRKLVTSSPLLEILVLEEVSGLEEIRVDIQHNLASNFSNLSSIYIHKCGRLRRLFSLSVMGSGGCFPKLERLEIRNCEMMEQVFMWNEDETKITHIPLVFPKLNFISLAWLPNLTCFIKGIEAIEFPQLAHLQIRSCPKLKEFVYSGSSAHHHGVGDDHLHLSCDPYKVTFGNLSKLYIFGERMMNLCLQAPNDSFARLSELDVSEAKGVNRLFSFSMTESNCLHQLEKLKISDCDMMEEVILWKEEENQMDINIITLFPKLKDLSLSYLPRLTSLSKGIDNIIFHVPSKMFIDKCPLLESCASEITDEIENDGYTHLFCNPHHKVEFGSLKELEICGSWEDKMSRSWCPQIKMIELFGGVGRLSVTGLNAMESLLPYLIAEKMENIKDLHIYGCVEMVRVIEDKADACETTPPILLFPKLESLKLSELHKLESFCEWRCRLKLPSLLKLEISKCDVMKELTSRPIYTPNLKTMEIDKHKLNGIDVSGPLQLSSLRKQAEKEKYNHHHEKYKRFFDQELDAEFVTDEASSSMQAT